jgi:hypothetical protein
MSREQAPSQTELNGNRLSLQKKKLAPEVKTPGDTKLPLKGYVVTKWK